jgi:hypothetical protein
MKLKDLKKLIQEELNNIKNERKREKEKMEMEVAPTSRRGGMQSRSMARPRQAAMRARRNQMRNRRMPRR